MVTVTELNRGFDFDGSDVTNVGAFDADSVNTTESRSKSLPVHDVTHPDYGAVGDGDTDDTSAINQAVTEADPGGVVYFPPGDYAISDSVDVYQTTDLTLQFDSGASLVPTGAGTTGDDFVAIRAFDSGTTSDSTLTEGLEIIGATVIGENTAEPWQDVEAAGFKHGVQAAYVEDLTVENFTASGLQQKPVFVTGSSNGISRDVHIDGLTADHCGSHVVNFDSLQNQVKSSVVSNVTAFRCGNGGSTLVEDGTVIDFSQPVEGCAATNITAIECNGGVKSGGRNNIISNATLLGMGAEVISSVGGGDDDFSNIHAEYRTTNLIDVDRGVLFHANDSQYSDITIKNAKFFISILGNIGSQFQNINIETVGTFDTFANYAVRFESDSEDIKTDAFHLKHNASNIAPFRDDSTRSQHNNLHIQWVNNDVTGCQIQGSNQQISNAKFETGGSDALTLGGDGTVCNSLIDAPFTSTDLDNYESAANKEIAQ